MPNYKRVTLKEVKQAYKTTKAKPATGFYFKENSKKCCAMAALALTHGITTSEQAWKWGTKKYGVKYEAGFVAGFDTCKLDMRKVKKLYVSENTTERFLDGLTDGRRVALGLGLGRKK